MRGQPSRQKERGVMPEPSPDSLGMAEFPVFSGGYQQNFGQDPKWQTHRGAGIPLNILETDYESFCDPEVTTNRMGCLDQYFYMSHCGQYQAATNVNVPTGISWTKQRRPFPFYEWACMGQYQNQYPDTQYPFTKHPWGIDKVYGASFNDWVMGPWIMAITQEVYHQYNPAVSTPWQMPMGYGV